jgi:GNAT superfamily N-acetyltransferase
MKSPLSVAVRRATVEDAEAIAGLSGELGYPATVEQSQARLRAILGADDHVVLVACDDDGDVVAWVHAFVALRVEYEPFIEISGFVVAEPLRGRGVGKRLLAAVEAWVLERGITQLRVRSRSDRAAARAFYAGLGFVRTKEQNVFDKQVKSGS